MSRTCSEMSVGVVAVRSGPLARDRRCRPQQCLVALRRPVDAPEVELVRGRVGIGKDVVEVHDLHDHVEVALVHEAKADSRQDTEQTQRADRGGEVEVVARDPALDRLPRGGVDAHQLDPVEQVIEGVPRARRSGARGDQAGERLVVGAARGRHRLAAAAQLGEEVVQGHVRGGDHRLVVGLEVHRLRERRDVQDRVGDDDLRA